MRADPGLRRQTRLRSSLHTGSLTDRRAHARQVGRPLMTDAAQPQLELILTVRHDDENADSADDFQRLQPAPEARSEAPQATREGAVESSMCRQGPKARRTARALSCTPNRVLFSGWWCHDNSPFTDISQMVVWLQRARSGSDAPCTPPRSSPACRDACRRGAYVRRVRGASSIRHFDVVADTCFPVLAPQTRYRAFRRPGFASPPSPACADPCV